MRKGSLLVPGLLAATALAAVFGPSCAQERKDVPPSNSGLGPGVTPGTTSGGGDGDGDGDGDAGGGGGEGGGRGDGGRGGGGVGGGVGGGPESSPNCACLLDVGRTEACGTCVQFGVVDECNDAYSACQTNSDCISVDICILDRNCQNSACIAECRSFGTPEALDLLDVMYRCACTACSEVCDEGDSCF